ncbi:hypothetical protein [Bradyrhizobium commune]|uniref:hypothetical protein n=1 Tax=Bradyrhizobium commune TaxID=83627 RepID=UPI001FED96CE|nr:hypothetical protein [Bradyrhizobium commune]
MSSSGPEDHVIKGQTTKAGPDYGLVKLTPGVLDVLKEYGPGVLSVAFPDRRLVSNSVSVMWWP